MSASRPPASVTNSVSQFTPSRQGGHSLRSLLTAFWLLACVLSQGGASSAQTDEAFDAGAPIFKYAFGARSYGMGGTGVADVADPANLYLNPANLALVRGVHFTGCRNQVRVSRETGWLSNGGISVGYRPTLNGPTGIGLTGDLRFGRIDYGPIDFGDYGENGATAWDANENYVGLSAATGTMISGRAHVAFGAAFKYWWADYAPSVSAYDEPFDGTANTVALDLGVRIAASLFRKSGLLFKPAIGVGYVNLGSDVDLNDVVWPVAVSSDLPRAVRYGISARLESHSSSTIEEGVNHGPSRVCVSINGDVTDAQVSSRSNIYGGGLELGVMGIVFLRAGYIRDRDFEIDDATFGFGIGLEAERFHAHADYARIPAGGDRSGLNTYSVWVGALF